MVLLTISNTGVYLRRGTNYLAFLGNLNIVFRCECLAFRFRSPCPVRVNKYLVRQGHHFRIFTLLFNIIVFLAIKMKNVNSNNKYFDPVLVFQASDSTTISTL